MSIIVNPLEISGDIAAEKIARPAFSASEESSDTRWSRRDLADAYLEADRADKTIDMYERAFADDRQVWSEEDRVTLSLRDALALTYQRAGER